MMMTRSHSLKVWRRSKIQVMKTLKIDILNIVHKLINPLAFSFYTYKYIDNI